MMDREIAIKVPDEFLPYAEAASMRMRYVFPGWEIVIESCTIRLGNIGPQSEADARREVAYALYRERIRSEGAPLRELLLKSVMA
jgi:hypothetical protein